MRRLICVAATAAIALTAAGCSGDKTPAAAPTNPAATTSAPGSPSDAPAPSGSAATGANAAACGELKSATVKAMTTMINPATTDKDAAATVKTYSEAVAKASKNAEGEFAKKLDAFAADLAAVKPADAKTAVEKVGAKYENDLVAACGNM
ncbi:hypothetical protein [Pilimelia columellifera]|uniref:Uncharacterized protein n=1 Tax=Pilimelia columellifera subsp. columellifera TaxID=706583 RepID=A0ABP6ADX8_9ACTN